MPLRQPQSTYTLTDQARAVLERRFSSARLGTYKRASGHDDNLAMNLYLWNIKMSQSLYFPIQTLEVSLRNAIDAVLVGVIGANWSNPVLARGLLQPQTVDEIRKSADRISRRRKRAATHDEIVADLSFGFWVACLNKRYNRQIWSRHLFTAFPNLPQQRKLTSVKSKLEAVNKLRNRIAHHEPLVGEDVSGRWSDIKTCQSWICPDTHRWMTQHASVPIVMRERPR